MNSIDYKQSGTRKQAVLTMPRNIIGIILQHCLISSVISYPFNGCTTCLYSSSLASPLPSDKHKHSRENACLSPRDRLCSGIFPSPLDPTQVSAVVPALFKDTFNNYKRNTIFSGKSCSAGLHFYPSGFDCCDYYFKFS